jgi:glycosyltransferase involved in cell wall biosynthesis
VTADARILALVPAYNEAPRIGRVVREASKYLPVLVVDDGSEDDTGQAAEAGGAVVVRHPQNVGKGAALMTGFGWAKEHGYDAVLTLDADGQHDPADIPKLVAAYDSGAGDLVIGRRDSRRMPFPRFFTNPFGSWLLSLALGVKVYDNQSGFRVYGERLLEGLKLESVGLEAEVEVIAAAVSAGLTIGWVDIRTIYGIGKRSSFHPIVDTARFFGAVWRARKHRLSAGESASVDGRSAGGP